MVDPVVDSIKEKNTYICIVVQRGYQINAPWKDVFRSYFLIDFDDRMIE